MDVCLLFPFLYRVCLGKCVSVGARVQDSWCQCLLYSPANALKLLSCNGSTEQSNTTCFFFFEGALIVTSIIPYKRASQTCYLLFMMSGALRRIKVNSSSHVNGLRFLDGSLLLLHIELSCLLLLTCSLVCGGHEILM